MVCEPLRDRTDIAEFANTLKKTGYAAEIGVWKGEFAAHNLKFWTGEYLGIDNWDFRKDGSTDKNMEDRKSWTEVWHEALRNTNEFHPRVRLIQGLSVEQAKVYPDEFFDWIYLDALHDYDSVKADLEAWYPKLMKGGLFSGDDYGDQSSRWANKYGHWGQIYKWGVIESVNEFARKVDRQVQVTWMNDKTPCPAWYFIK